MRTTLVAWIGYSQVQRLKYMYMYSEKTECVWKEGHVQVMWV